MNSVDATPRILPNVVNFFLQTDKVLSNGCEEAVTLMAGKLQSAAQYFRETEPAVKNLFESLEQYDVILKKIKGPMFITLNTSEEASEEAFRKWHKKNRPAIKRALERQRKYFGYQFSIGTLCASILQIAYMGINLFSKNNAIPPNFCQKLKQKLRLPSSVLEDESERFPSA